MTTNQYTVRVSVTLTLPAETPSQAEAKAWAYVQFASNTIEQKHPEVVANLSSMGKATEVTK